MMLACMAIQSAVAEVVGDGPAVLLGLLHDLVALGLRHAEDQTQRTGFVLLGHGGSLGGRMHS